MVASLRAFLDGLMDYAGLFPPARLDLDPALRNYARYRAGRDAWMLGRFIVPVARLGELDAYADLFEEAPPFRFSILLRAADDPFKAWPDDVTAARTFEHQHGGRAVADRFEGKISAAIAQDRAALEDLLGTMNEHLDASAGGEGPRIYCEVDLTGGLKGIERVAEAVAARNAEAGRPVAGLKFRCGGETPEAFPSPDALAHALVLARDASAPFKATAGLHHPFPRLDPETGATMHGFVNVFGSALLAHARHLSAAELRPILEDPGSRRFTFDADGFAWNGYGANTPEVADARAAFATSYGTCSFDEPRDDLRALGWL